jgi:transcriptional regulator with XRE-family HTH domain
MQTFYERLKFLIKEHAGGKHTLFAKKAGIPVSTFQSYLSERLPHIEHLLRICETYHVTLDWLMTGQGDRYRPMGEVRQPAADYASLRIDTLLLREIIRTVEDGLQSRQAILVAEKKAELIGLLYEMHVESGRAVELQTVDRYLRLAI